MNKITHEVIVYVDSSTFTANPPLDIHQGDSNTHILMIKLRTKDDKFVSLTDNSKATISFLREDGTLVVSSTVDIVRPYRGIMCYTLGPAIVKDSGRLTATLDISACNCGCDCGPMVSFVVNIAKTATYSSCACDPSKVEVTITKEMCDEIREHLDDAGPLKHLDEDNRDFVEELFTLQDKLFEILDIDFDKKIDDRIKELTAQQMAQSFITVDYLYPSTTDPTATSLYGLKPEECFEGKIVRVNYLNHDGNNDTLEIHEDPWQKVGYFVCKRIGNNNNVEWHPWNIAYHAEYAFHKVREILRQIAEIQEIVSQLDPEEINQRLDELATRMTAVETIEQELSSQVESHDTQINQLTNVIDTANPEEPVIHNNSETTSLELGENGLNIQSDVINLGDSNGNPIKITNVANPVNDTDVANKQYVDEKSESAFNAVIVEELPDISEASYNTIYLIASDPDNPDTAYPDYIAYLAVADYDDITWRCIGSSAIDLTEIWEAINNLRARVKALEDYGFEDFGGDAP